MALTDQQNYGINLPGLTVLLEAKGQRSKRDPWHNMTMFGASNPRLRIAGRTEGPTLRAFLVRPTSAGGGGWCFD